MRERTSAAPRLPLDGVRVTDVTSSWAGPYLTNIMGALGAEIIKVDSLQRLDIWRSAATQFLSRRERPWEWSPNWNSVNTDKLCITLNLRDDRGADVFKRLVEISDVVVENYTPRVMPNFGLGYPTLRDLNPSLIMISMPTHGVTGPWNNVPGFAMPNEMMAGFVQLMGYPDREPMHSGTGITDPIAGMNGMIAVVFALIQRKMTGEGQYIDLSQIEAAASMIGDALVDTAINKRVPPRRGNRHPTAVPHGYYRCKGDDLWVSIAVSTDEEWTLLCAALGNPAWTRDERFSDRTNRMEHQDELDALIEAWTVNHDHYEVMGRLQEAGVAACAVLTSEELLSDPHLQDRGTFQLVDREVIGAHHYVTPTAPIHFSEMPVRIRRPAPFLGEHNDFVCSGLLGMSRQEIDDLVEDRIIGTEP